MGKQMQLQEQTIMSGLQGHRQHVLDRGGGAARSTRNLQYLQVLVEDSTEKTP